MEGVRRAGRLACFLEASGMSMIRAQFGKGGCFQTNKDGSNSSILWQ